MSIILTLLILSFLVIIHELGHFLVAKRFGVKVEEFGLGYPPRALKLGKKWGTLFSLNWIPFGGFVRLEGEDQSDETSLSSNTSMQTKSALQRLAIILAGAAVNFGFGMVAFAVIFSWIGIPVSGARVGGVSPDSPASQAGLPLHGQIDQMSFGENQLHRPTIDQVKAFATQHTGQTVQVVMTKPCDGTKCPDQTQTFQIYVRTKDEAKDQGAMGVIFEDPGFQFYPWYEMPFRGAWYGVYHSIQLGIDTLAALESAVVTGVSQRRLPEELSGPVGIAYEAQKQDIFAQGWLAQLSFAAIISVNLAIMNVLPIPMLDGGRAVMILLEPFLSKRRVQRYEGYVNGAGMVLLLSLIVVITARDIVRIIYGT